MGTVIGQFTVSLFPKGTIGPSMYKKYGKVISFLFLKGTIRPIMY